MPEIVSYLAYFPTVWEPLLAGVKQKNLEKILTL
jgi:hypothetical protein